MTEKRDQLDTWLDTAMAEYALVQPSPGFEARMIAELRARASRRLLWIPLTSLSVAAAIVAVIFIFPVLRTKVGVPPQLHSQIAGPQIQRVAIVVATPEPKQVVARHDATRGVPIVATPLNPQEEAILRVVRNARAPQLATLTPERPVVNEKNFLEFRELDIPLVTREEVK